jgi:hypothetical protein
VRGASVVALVMVTLVACTQAPSAVRQATSSPAPPAHSLPGGCAGTVLTDAMPPKWAQTGWTVAAGSPWPVRWSFGQPADSIAFMFAGQLVAGPSPRKDGTSNKVLWVLKDAALGGFTVEAKPLGQYQPVVNIAGGPSIDDVPTPGCWTFTMRWTVAGSARTSVINLEVLPEGSVPGLA